MSTQSPLISLCQETKSQKSLKPPTEMHRRMKAKQGKYGIELIEEMNKPVVTHQPTQRSPSIPYFSRFARRHRSYVSPSDDDDELYDWRGRQVVFPQPGGGVVVIGRISQPGFS